MTLGTCRPSCSTTAVHPATHPGGVDHQRPPVGRRIRGAGVRCSTRPRSRRTGRVLRSSAMRAARRVRRCPSGTSPTARSSRTSRWTSSQETVAIVGPTGAGKTTLVNLIMRFYELDFGKIRLDGADISTMRRHDVRRDRHGAAGRLVVRRHDPRQHRLRRARGHGGTDPRGGADQLRRPLRPFAPRRLRHGRRRPGHQPERR